MSENPDVLSPAITSYDPTAVADEVQHGSGQPVASLRVVMLDALVVPVAVPPKAPHMADFRVSGVPLRQQARQSAASHERAGCAPTPDVRSQAVSISLPTLRARLAQGGGGASFDRVEGGGQGARGPTRWTLWETRAAWQRVDKR